MNTSIRLCFCVFILAHSFASSPRPPVGPPSIQCIQGNDDQVMSLHLLETGRIKDLDLRYRTIQQKLTPGNRRYNLFWTEFESTLPSSAPMTCPSATLLVPANETDRLARGYHNYHCYNHAALSANDALLSMDAAINGSVSTAIVYGTPDYAIHPNCTGFPWPPNPNFRLGCLPWNHFNDWEDFLNLILERWNAPLGSGAARLSGLCIWNEIQSMGWSDPSPVLPNRYNGHPFTPDQMNAYAGAVAELFKRAGKAASRHSEGVMLWLSTDHFTLPPPLALGDVDHIGMYDFLDAFWPHVVAEAFSWGVCVHPYDAGDPRQDLLDKGIYTFATLRKGVADYQCQKLHALLGVPLEQCWHWPQTQLWASEQGWPYNNVTMPKSKQTRNICYAHALSVEQRVWSVTHNFMQSPVSSDQGGAGDFSLLDEPPVCYGNLTNCDGLPTYEAYKSTAAGVWGESAGHYCCKQWETGCPKR